MFIPDPDFCPSRFPDPTTKEEGGETFVVRPCKEKNFAPVPHSERIIVIFTQKIVTKLSKIWVWDPVPRSGIRICNTAFSA
jgi:hypothetical protein